MRKGVLIVLVITSILLAACSSKQPRIELEATQFDFGNVVNGEIINHDLVVRNDGDAPLIAETVSTTCGCTRATLEPMTIQAGGGANLHITFDSGAHGQELTGQVIRQIFIASNDPNQPEAMVEFSANVLPKEVK
jgi:hypothetical protein